VAIETKRRQRRVLQTIGTIIDKALLKLHLIVAMMPIVESRQIIEVRFSTCETIAVGADAGQLTFRTV
jgi:hypothetical protein